MKQKIMESGLVRRLSGLHFFRYLAAHPVFGKIFNYEMITYITAGFLTTVVNYVVYFLMPRFESGGLDIVLANAAAWIAAVAFAFVVNKIFVFDSPSWERKIFLRELVQFVSCRLLSLGLETVFLYFTVEVLGLNEPLFKIISNIFVLIINYIASKFLIFRKGDSNVEVSTADEKYKQR